MLHSRRLESVTIPVAWRFFPQRQITRNLTQNHAPVFKKHLVEAKTEKHTKKYEAAFRSFWQVRGDKLTKFRLGNWSKKPVPDYHNPAPRQDVSATQKWLTAVGSDFRVVPRDLPQVEFPAGDITLIPPAPAKTRTRTRTDEDRQRVEAVLKLPMSPLARYVSPEMIDRLKESPYYVHDEDAVVLRCHQHRSQPANRRQILAHVTCLIRNVAQEIVYREKMGDISDLQ